MIYINIFLNSLVAWMFALLTGFGMEYIFGFSLAIVLQDDLSEQHLFVVRLVEIVAPLVVAAIVQLFVNRKALRKQFAEPSEPLNKPFNDSTSIHPPGVSE